MAIFNSFLYVYQRVNPINIPIVIGKIPISITVKIPMKPY